MQSGGVFRLDSVINIGTTATLWLPVAQEAPVASTASDTVAPSAPRRATLLLVDDEALVRASTAGLLQELGYEVVVAGSATEALDLMRKGLMPELVVTDHMMPGMTGAELVTELRAKMPGLPVLMMTGYANLQTDEAQGMALIAKPFAFADLASRIAALIEPRQDGNVVALATRSRERSF